VEGEKKGTNSRCRPGRETGDYRGTIREETAQGNVDLSQKREKRKKWGKRPRSLRVGRKDVERPEAKLKSWSR